MEVYVSPPSPATVFSPTTTPYATAPSSPQSTIPFTWEEKPGTPKQPYYEPEHDTYTDFAFGYLERHSISAADELFDCGQIKPLKPLKPPPRLHSFNDAVSPKSPKSPKSRFREALSPRGYKKNDFDPFSEALRQTCDSCDPTQLDSFSPKRGRGRAMKHVRQKISRSLSPFRDVSMDDPKNIKGHRSSLTWYNKWNIKNLLLFRSVSEGSATTRKGLLKKHSTLFSFRSTDSGGTMKVSGDETGLPYKTGLLSCLRLNQNGGSVHEISRGIKSVMKQ